jgi:nicotinamidase/pyrazinamidase
MKTIYWNVDTTFDFMRNDKDHKGGLYVSGAERIEGNLESLTQNAARKNITVVNTCDWHTASTKEFSDNPDFVKTFPPHCLMGTKGAEYIPATMPNNPYVVDWKDHELDDELVEESRNIVIRKDAFDVFDTKEGNKFTKDIVDIINPDRVIVYGVATNYCVKFAVDGLLASKDRLKKNIDVYLVTDAVKEIPNETLESIMSGYKDKGVKLITTAQALELK